jgi:hypothetical protein
MPLIGRKNLPRRNTKEHKETQRRILEFKKHFEQCTSGRGDLIQPGWRQAADGGGQQGVHGQQEAGGTFWNAGK